MHQTPRRYEPRDRVIQHAIEVFDLVDITSAAKTGKVVDHHFLEADAVLAAAQYAQTESAYAHVAGNI